MNHLHRYLHSFKEWKKIILSFLLDSGTALLIFLVLSIFGRLIKSKVDSIMQGKSVEEVQQLFLSGSLENADLLTDRILSFAYTFVGGLIIISILCILLYSLSRAYVWNYLSHQKFNFRRHWRWNFMTLVMLIFFILYSALYFLVVLFILPLFLAAANATAASVITQLASFFLLLLFFFYGFNVSSHFVRSNQVWKSCGDAFHSFRSSSFFIFILFSLGTAVLVGIVSFYLRQATLRWYGTESVISIALLLLYVSWFRVYTLASFHHEKKLEAVVEK